MSTETVPETPPTPEDIAFFNDALNRACQALATPDQVDAMVDIRVTPGEAADRLTIAFIKYLRTQDDVAKLGALTAFSRLFYDICLYVREGAPELPLGAIVKLYQINVYLWGAEDSVRDLRLQKRMNDLEVCKLYYSISDKNDERSRVKNEINKAFGAVHEAKQYVQSGG